MAHALQNIFKQQKEFCCLVVYGKLKKDEIL